MFFEGTWGIKWHGTWAFLKIDIGDPPVKGPNNTPITPISQAHILSPADSDGTNKIELHAVEGYGVAMTVYFSYIVCEINIGLRTLWLPHLDVDN